MKKSTIEWCKPQSKLSKSLAKHNMYMFHIFGIRLAPIRVLLIHTIRVPNKLCIILIFALSNWCRWRQRPIFLKHIAADVLSLLTKAHPWIHFHSILHYFSKKTDKMCRRVLVWKRKINFVSKKSLHQRLMVDQKRIKFEQVFCTQNCLFL